MEGSSTEEAIIDAAHRVFLKKGRAGARMREIAEEAGLNRGLLHYYFRSKDKLFEIVLLESAKRLFGGSMRILNADLDLFEKIRQFVANFISVVLTDPSMPIFVLHELHANPERYSRLLLSEGLRPDPEAFFAQIRTAAAAGVIRTVEPVQLMMNIVSLCMFPFVGSVSFQIILGIPEERYKDILEVRKKEVAELIIDSIRPRKEIEDTSGDRET